MARGDNTPTAREIDAMLNQLDVRIEQLKQAFERYFIGIDRRPPLQFRRDVVREVFDAEQIYINSTAQRFKLRSIVQKFNTYKTYWNRTMRQIEEGTYHRDRSRVQRRQDRQDRARQARETDDQGAYELDLDADFLGDLQDVDLEAILEIPLEPVAPAGPTPEELKRQRLAEIQRQLGAAPEPAQPREPLSERERKLAAMQEKLQQRDTSGRVDKLLRMKQKLQQEHSEPRAIQRPSRPSSGPTAPAPSNLRTSGSHRVVQRSSVPPARPDDDAARRVYNNLIEAKRRCNEPTDNLSFDAVKRSMEKQRESLQKKRGAREVDFQVVIKDGKAYLKPETKD